MCAVARGAGGKVVTGTCRKDQAPFVGQAAQETNSFPTRESWTCRRGRDTEPPGLGAHLLLVEAAWTREAVGGVWRAVVLHTSSINTDKWAPHEGSGSSCWATAGTEQEPCLGPSHPPVRSTDRGGSVGLVGTAKINGAGAGRVGQSPGLTRSLVEIKCPTRACCYPVWGGIWMEVGRNL